MYISYTVRNAKSDNYCNHRFHDHMEWTLTCFNLPNSTWRYPW